MTTVSILVVGGTGMLAEVAAEFAQRGEDVCVVARSVERFTRMLPASPSSKQRLHFVPVDFRDAPAWTKALQSAHDAWGPFDPVVVRMTLQDDEPLANLTGTLHGSQGERPWRLFHVRSSAASRRQDLPPVPPSCRYRQIILGFVLEGDGARWLTHSEIFAGTLAAVDEDAPYRVIGVVEPWDRRPPY